MPPNPPPKRRKRSPSAVIHGIGPNGQTLCGKGGNNPKTAAISEEVTCKSCLQSYLLGDDRVAKTPKPTGKMVWIPSHLVAQVEAWLAGGDKC